MTGPQTFDWTVIDKALSDADKGKMHVVLRMFLHYPDQPLRVPVWLINQGIELRTIESGEKSPQYDDPKLLAAIKTFIQALGAKYDGHKNLAFLQLGLLGKWGEWHTYPDEGLLSASTKDAVVGWYQSAFKTTPLQVRNPWKAAYEAGMGLHDDSFGFSTLDGPYNGGEEQTWFFWPEVKAASQEDFWRKGVMGGETRPEIQGEIFESGYRAGTPNKQDFFTCVDVTHATYMFHHNAFINGQALTGSELDRTLDAHVELGYNYRVSKVAAKANGSSKVTVDITVEQIGVAPFYYPLSLKLKCDTTEETLPGVEELIENGATKVFSFTTIPADSDCLDNVEILLYTDRAHDGRPVRFAQGSNGRVQFSLPLPSEVGRSNEQPQLPAPTQPPTKSQTPPTTVIPKETNAVVIDSGVENEDTSIVSGSTTWANYVDQTINGADGESIIFQTHRWGPDFTYTISGLTANSVRKLTLGFAETYEDACFKGRRVFDIAVNGQELISNLDVFDKAGGCNTAYVVTESVLVNTDGKLVINFKASTNNAMISLIEVDSLGGKSSNTDVELGWLQIFINFIVALFFGGGK